jgi:hypothetical protein
MHGRKRRPGRARLKAFGRHRNFAFTTTNQGDVIMSINTKIRLTILASAVALAAAAPAAFAMGPDKNYHPESGTPDATNGKSIEQISNQKLVPVDVVPDTGTPDATAGHEAKKIKHMKHTKHLKHMKHNKIAPSDPDSPAIQ